MFFYDNWDYFCGIISSIGLKTCTAEESLIVGKDTKYIVLKHDVEDNVSRALKLASIEHKHNIRGSYYVQAYLLNKPENVVMLQKMQKMGHEISYHYDVLDANSGDFIKAETDFNKWLKCFHNHGFDFKTICQHGNPIKNRVGYNSNRDFFRNKSVKSHFSHLVDMVVDYSQYTNQKYIYISDAGYMWKHITEPETNDLNPNAKTIEIGGFKNLIEYIKSADCSVILSTHPHRWEASKARIESKILFFKCARATARFLQRIPVANALLNKFYFLAKKI